MIEGTFWRTAFTVLVPLCVLVTVVPGCGPTREEIAKREAEKEASRKAWEAWKLELSSRQERLRTYVQQRIAAGKSPPPKVTDPGDAIAYCEEILVDGERRDADDVFSFNTGFGPTVICGNSKAAKAIVRWRKWYCEGSEHMKRCVVCAWHSGEPIFECGAPAGAVVRLRKGPPQMPVILRDFQLRDFELEALKPTRKEK